MVKSVSDGRAGGWDAWKRHVRLLSARLSAFALLILLASFAAPSTAAAQGGLVDPPGGGPAALAARSVMRIVSFANPDARPPRRERTEELPRLDRARFRFPMPPAERLAFQGEACRASGLEWCPVFEEETRGTAFSLHAEGRFVTCRHLFHDWLHWSRVFNPGAALERLVPPFALVGDGGRLSFISAGLRPGDFRVALWLSDPRLAAPLSELLDQDVLWDADIFGFELAEGPALPPLAEGGPLLRGERVTLLGFPESGGAARVKASSGVVTERRVASAVTSAASAKGMSGGPVLDAAGLVRGMSCALGRSRPGGRATAFAIPVNAAELARGLARAHGVRGGLD